MRNVVHSGVCSVVRTVVHNEDVVRNEDVGSLFLLAVAVNKAADGHGRSVLVGVMYHVDEGILVDVQEVHQYADEGVEYPQEGARLVRILNGVSRRVGHLADVPPRGGVERRAQVQHRNGYLLVQVQQIKSVKRKPVTTAGPKVM